MVAIFRSLVLGSFQQGKIIQHQESLSHLPHEGLPPGCGCIRDIPRVEVERFCVASGLPKAPGL